MTPALSAAPKSTWSVPVPQIESTLRSPQFEKKSASNLQKARMLMMPSAPNTRRNNSSDVCGFEVWISASPISRSRASAELPVKTEG